MAIVMGAGTATNIQSCGKPRVLPPILWPHFKSHNYSTSQKIIFAKSVIYYLPPRIIQKITLFGIDEYTARQGNICTTY